MVKNGKSIVCGTCGRHFGARPALEQHRVDAHPKKTPQPRVVRAKRVSNGAKAGAPVSRALTERASQYDNARIKGTDRFATIPDVTQFKAGQVLVDKLITPGDFTRLKTVAEAFQKIKYIKLVFKIDPQIATATSGGYVAAVVRDPADAPPAEGSGLLSFLTSQNGSVTTKWWQNAIISVTDLKDRVYFTSSSVEVREYSPCRFMLAVDGAATQKGNLTVFCEWEVALHTASYEDRREEMVYTTTDHLYISENQGAALCVKNGALLKPAPINTISGAKIGDRFRLPHPIVITEEDGSVRMFWYVNILAENDLRPAAESPSDTVTGQPKTEALMLLKGSVLTFLEPEKVFQPVASSSGTTTPRGRGSETSIEDFMLLFRQFVKLSRGSRKNSHHLMEQSQSRELHRSMESLRNSEESFDMMPAEQAGSS